MRFGVMSAMPEELAAVLDELTLRDVVEAGGRRFHVGTLAGRDAVLVSSRMGKVAAAVTATMLLDRFACDAIVFTGVAGGAAPGVAVGDVVIGERLIQHDLDASPIFPRYQVPLLGVSIFDADPELSARAAAAAEAMAAHAGELLGPEAQRLGIDHPRVHRGLIASGDKFFASAADLAELRKRLPDTLAVEMEGAAVAQVAFEHDAPFVVIRVISDTADHAAPVDFARFVAAAPGPYARAIVRGVIAGDGDAR
jgi:adenosylhomocysteine nucleosidase